MILRLEQARYGFMCALTREMNDVISLSKPLQYHLFTDE